MSCLAPNISLTRTCIRHALASLQEFAVLIRLRLTTPRIRLLPFS